MMKITNIVTALIIAALLCCGCGFRNADDSASDGDGNTTQSLEPITLSSEELDVLDKMGDDVIIVPGTEYSEVIAGIKQSPTDHVGKVYTFEGYCVMLDVHGEKQPHLSDIADVTGSASDGVLQLRYLVKEIPDKSHIRVTVIVATDDHDAHSHIVLDVVAIETIG